MAENDGNQENVQQPEAPGQDPTKVSDNFLARIRNNITENWRKILPIVVGGGIWLNGNLIDDLSRGDYELAVFKGAISVASIVPLLLHWEGGGEEEPEATTAPIAKTTEKAAPAAEGVVKPPDGSV